MSSALTSDQHRLLLQAAEADGVVGCEGILRDLRVLQRAGLISADASGTFRQTDAGRRYVLVEAQGRRD